ncbi:hypothetical protein K493DRAFT_332582 [Basidiobolus meristosporus CBS 931.73]|uniref:DUF4097 domain-containing protein n=1 Tax=Basidiobolus meristosporus CBS 931.73 TaxID=1314790 RepID=A0A1Y1ZCY9_9FUNG|nr:hypothetical protein K493DRAFT_332582 [Basidiobolus meristosporus CBS 931.73]|eukprot:ORY07837.1 hypothetical protein K493DRAFT_332582 [Basidiobolus meristosporus CBS 931.73]
MSEQLPIAENTENPPSYGSITRDSDGVLRNPDGTVWSPLSGEQMANSWKLYFFFLLSVFLLWQGYEWGPHLLKWLPKEKHITPEIPFEGESNFLIDTEHYQALSFVVNTTTTVTNVAITTGESQDTKSIRINSVTFAENFHDKSIIYEETRADNHYTLTLNGKGTDFQAITNIQIVLPPTQFNLNSLTIVLPAGRVNSSILHSSRINDLHIEVANGTIALKDVQGSNINLKTSVGDITGTFDITHTYNAISGQGNIDCRLRVPSHSMPQIAAGTSVGNVTARVTDTYHGPFSLFTERGRAYVFGGRYVDFTTNTTLAKNGYFRGQDGDANILMHAKRGRVVLAFRRQV